MYETYFHLTDRPFAAVPRTDHYYPAGAIDAAQNNLTRCVGRGEGIALIVGPPGTGKSLLCQALADHFQKKFQVALLASTHLDTRRSLLQAILYELNRPWRGMDEGELRLTLVDYFALNDDCSGGALLVVDDAHHLALRLLDEIRALTNLTRSMHPAVRLVLAGNHLLEERLASPKLESFSQRISARCYLEAFQRDETQAYIWARIMVSGGRGDAIFPVETCRMIHKATGGVPRLVNQVCDHVLLMAYAAAVERIEPAHVEMAWADLQQLPTPWNAAATAPAGDGVVEFGGLDDEPADTLPIAGTISADDEDDDPCEESTTETATAPVAAVEVAMDDETLRRLRQVRRLLNDVRTEFEPRTARGPFDLPHPFAEPFDEEEVISERFPVAPPVETPPPVVVMRPAAAAVERRPDTIALPQDDALAEASAADRILHPPRLTVPPPRKEFGRLFAKLRKGI